MHSGFPYASILLSHEKIRRQHFAVIVTDNLLAFCMHILTETIMATLTIRNLDDAVVERLKKRAKDNERSLEAEIRTLLTNMSEHPSRKDFIALAKRIAAMTPDVPQTDSVELIREDRDR
jgi:plasmid stability protein